MIKLFSLVFLLSSLSVFAKDKSVSDKPSKCSASKEYITTYKFLNDKKEYQLSGEQILKISDHVSKGCSGAASRFIKTMKMLTKVGISGKDSLVRAKKFSHLTDTKTNAFISLYKMMYTPQFLNLNALEALNLSQKISEIVGEDDKAIDRNLNDVKRLSSFCMSKNFYYLGPAKCSALVYQISASAAKNQEELSEEFISLVKFMAHDSDGPRLTVGKSFSMAKEVMKYGKMGAKNFVEAYKFSTSKKGLNLPNKKATLFAKRMALRS